MSNRQICWLMMIAVAIVGMIAASSALADPVNPFSPSLADIQGMGNTTQSANASTIDAIHIAPNGIHLDVTWRTGQSSDPFGPNFGKQTYPRVGVTKYTNSEDPAGDPPVARGRLLNPPYDGIKWCLMSDLPLFSQPFIQTAPNWRFYEPSNGGNNIAGDMSMQMSILDFNTARNFAGQLPANIVHPDVNGEIRANAFGLQLLGPGGIVPGQDVPGHIWITYWIPEPSTATLLLLGAVGLLGRARRRQG